MNYLVKLLLVLFIAVSTISINAQDIIIKMDGDLVQSKVQKISKTEIEYKKWSNLDGPTYTISIAEVFAINYENGEKDVFMRKNVSSADGPGEEKSNSGNIKAAPNKDNDALISSYNEAKVVWKEIDDKKNKKAKSVFSLLGITPESVMSTDELSISIAPVKSGIALYVDEGAEQEIFFINKFNNLFSGRYVIELKNNTDKNIYIDKANCFRIEPDGIYRPYYSSDKISITKENGDGMSIGLGAVAGALGVGGAVGTLANGIGIGGSSSSSVTTTKTDDRIIVIPPYGKVPLSKDEMTHVKGDKYIVNHKAEYFDKLPTYFIDNLMEGEIRSVKPEDAEIRRYIISYTDDPTDINLKQLDLGVYLRECIGKGNPPSHGYGKPEIYMTGYDTYDKFLKKHVQSIDANAIMSIIF